MAISAIGAEWGVATTAAVASITLPAHTFVVGADVFVFAVGRTPATLVTPSDGSNTYHQIGSTIDGTSSTIIGTLWRTTVTTGGSLTITLTPTGGNSGMCGSAWQFGGLIPYGTSQVDLDVTAASSSNSTAIVVGPTGTSAQPNELVLAMGS